CPVRPANRGDALARAAGGGTASEQPTARGPALPGRQLDQGSIPRDRNDDAYRERADRGPPGAPDRPGGDGSENRKGRGPGIVARAWRDAGPEPHPPLSPQPG